MPLSAPLGHGVATASYQVEGAVDADGRGPSIWDTFSAEDGTIVDASSGADACGSYERLEEDLALVEGLGVGAYRFSIAWPRVQPAGSGAVNGRGLDYYERLVDGLLARGITPMPTLYHWDLPQPLEDAGGWPARDTAHRLADYTGLVLDRLGDRVTTWATLNEPWCSAFLGYAAGVHAPGRRNGPDAYAAAHHLLLGHALAADVIRAKSSDAEVGIVLNLAPVRAEPGGDPRAVAMVDAVQNGLWLDALTAGRYPELIRGEQAMGQPDLVRDGDLDAIRGSAQWIGLNYYFPMRVGAPGTGTEATGHDVDAFPGSPDFAFVQRPPTTTMGWEVDPSGLVELLTTVAGRAPGVPLRITENGAAYPDDSRDASGAIVDDDRIAYLRDHLAAVDRARAAGIPVVDYLAWTLMDNFEWAKGYTQTFGLVEVDRTTMRRTPKKSYGWYADHVKAARAT